MKNKKGFTITELVIVIAVIAILAGVMIPTFGGIIEKANKSAAIQKAASQYKIDLAAIDAQVENYVADAYALSTDTDVKAGKTYYTKGVDDKYTAVAAPTGNPSTSSYYELVKGNTEGEFKGTLNDYTIVIDDKYTCVFNGSEWTATKK